MQDKHDGSLQEDYWQLLSSFELSDANRRALEHENRILTASLDRLLSSPILSTLTNKVLVGLLPDPIFNACVVKSQGGYIVLVNTTLHYLCLGTSWIAPRRAAGWLADFLRSSFYTAKTNQKQLKTGSQLPL